MLKYIFQRIAFAILTLIVISIFVYVLVSVFGSNPLRSYAEAEYPKISRNNPNLTFDAYLQNLELERGIRYAVIDAGGNSIPGAKIPVLIRYFAYIGGVFRGEFGDVLNPANNPDPEQYRTLPQLFFIPLRNTTFITLPSMLLSLVIGIGLGIFAGYKRGKLIDSSINVFVLIFVALPSFIIAPLAIAIGVKLGILPVVPRFEDESFGTIFVAYLPPIIVSTLSSLAGGVILTRNMVITVLTSNYVLIAKTKGLSETQIFFKYVLRNSFIPLFGLIFGSFLGLLSGSVIIEQYWGIKGTSQVILNGFSTGEINVIMFSTLFFTLIGLFAAILVDLAYLILDPRITYTSKSKRNYTMFFKAYLERRKLEKELFATQITKQGGVNGA
ncbi:ABC transporter permease [Mycoplasmopsis columbina]|uniref:ABC transporter permease n=1 Tax=Mycoplasmopsis columbina TaxID=114881 RepID=UPI0004A746C5|nr:ABC transporter permease [Mycoplasmopsis columbina]VEU76974.1 oligopeptide ABC transporter permease [Mycoplasmopsis columbina]